MLNPHLADSPPSRHRQSTWPGVRPVHRLFLRVRGSIRRRSCVLLQDVCGPSAQVSQTVRAVQVTLRPSVGRVRTVRISGCSTSCLGSFYRLSAVVSRIVRPATMDNAPQAPHIAYVLCFLSCASVFPLSWGLFLGLVGLL
jgi:hypothetical protein